MINYYLQLQKANKYNKGGRSEKAACVCYHIFFKDLGILYVVFKLK